MWDLRDTFFYVNLAADSGRTAAYFLGAPYAHDDFRIQFNDCGFERQAFYVTEWFDDASDRASATRRRRSGGGRVRDRRGALCRWNDQRHVSSDQTGAALAEACVTVVDENGRSVGGALTGPDGSYSVHGLAQGAWFVGFEDCLFDEHGPEWFDDVPVRSACLFCSVDGGDPVGDGADPVQVELATEISGVDALLSRQGIEGTVTDSATGQPIEGCSIVVWGEEIDGGQSGRGTSTGPDGSYDFESIPVTGVHVEVFCPGGYLHEWYLDRADEGSADRISIQPRTVIGGIDLAVDRGGEINGTVTESTGGSAAADICVQAWQTGIDDPQGSEGFAITDDAGRYTIDSLPTGDYAVSFSDCGDRAQPLAQEFFDDAADYFTATPVNVRAGGSAVTVDGVLEVAGAIAGQIIDPSGEPASFSCVEVFTPAGWSVGWQQVGLDGRFSVGSLHQGDYHVFFDADPVAACGLLENDGSRL